MLAYTATTDTDQVALTATPADDAAAVRYLDANGIAIADADSDAEGHQITLAATETTVKIEVTGPGADSTTYTLTIHRTPNLSINTPGALKENTGPVTLIVTMKGRSASDVTVEYTTVDGTAVAGEDYTTNTGTLTFAPEETEKRVSIEIIDDEVFEGSDPETFTVQLHNPVNGDIEAGTATVTIIDNDKRPELSIADTEVNEADETATLTVTMKGRSASDVTIAYSTVDGTAVAGQDYTAKTSTITFASSDAPTQRRQVTVEITDDDVYEQTEAFTVELRNPVNGIIKTGAGSATVTVVDDDPWPVLSIGDVRVNEADETATLTVAMTGRSASDVIVDYSTVDGTAVAGQDYTAETSTVAFAPSDATTQRRQVTVAIIDDEVLEDTETFTVMLEESSGFQVLHGAGTATVTIEDDDSRDVSIVRAARRVEGANKVKLRVTLDPVNDLEEVSVGYRTSDGTAVAGEDYDAKTGTLVFEPGETEKHVVVGITDDVFDEADRETFSVILSGAVGATVGVGKATVTIEDNDEPPELSITGGGDAEEDAGSVTLTVTLSAESRRQVSVGYGTSDGTAVAGEDYDAKTGTLVFEPGQTEKHVVVGITDDDLDETRSEDFRVVLQNPENAAVNVGTATVVIKDNDPRPRLSIVGDIEVDEGADNAVFVVELNAQSGRTVGVEYATSDGTAQHGQDYGGEPSVLIFKPGTTTMTVSVPIIDDDTIESNEDFTITLSNPVHARLGDAQATALILDNDRPTVSISGNPELVVEGGVMQLVVALSRANTEQTVVTVASSHGTATDLDYRPLNRTVTIDVGDTEATIPIMIEDDFIDEYDETFTVSVVSADNAEFTAAAVTVTMTDNDDPPSAAFLDLTDGFETTEGTPATVRVKLLQESGKVVTISYTTRQSSNTDENRATPRLDYETTSGTLKFLPGAMYQEIVINTHEDTTAEGPETFEVQLTEADNAQLLSDHTIATVTINDNDNDDEGDDEDDSDNS